MTTSLLRRPLIRCALLAGVSAILPFLAQNAGAAGDAVLLLRPHCETQPCAEFPMRDLTSAVLDGVAVGANIDLDLVVKNPSVQPISRVRSWLLYDSTILQGMDITVADAFPLITPGEENFSPETGEVMIEVAAITGEEPSGAEIVVARIQFSVIAAPPQGEDVVSFYNVQAGGNTTVVTTTDAGEVDVLGAEPPSLFLVFANRPAAADSSSVSSALSASGSSSLSSLPATGGLCGNGILETSEECDDGNLLQGDGCTIFCKLETAGAASSTPAVPDTRLPDGSQCSVGSQCLSGLCSSGTCKGQVLKVPDGEACISPIHCISGNCAQGLCAPRSGTPPPDSVAFGMLQVRTLRLTTEGTTVYLAWDALPSSQVSAYNVYYGTTSGRYIQRKTVASDIRSLAIRQLPEQVTYYFAIRAANSSGTETQFSQEVSVEVGNPSTSTSPLVPEEIAPTVRENPLSARTPQSNLPPTTVPGETGLPSVLLWIAISSSVVGTAFAFRRQAIAVSLPE